MVTRMILIGMMVMLPVGGMAGERKPLLPGPPQRYDLFRPTQRIEVRPGLRRDGGMDIYRDGERQGRLVPDGAAGYRVERDLGRPTYDQVPGVTTPKR